MFKFWDWVRNPSKEIDNDEISNDDVQKIFASEGAELVEAFYIFCNKPTAANLLHFFEEAFDVVQAMLLLFRRVRRLARVNSLNYKNMFNKAYDDHNDKAIERKWFVSEKEVIEIEITRFKDEEGR